MGDDEIIEFCKSFRDGILEGRNSAMCCAMVCWPLQALLSIYGVETTAMTTPRVICDFGETNHMWLRLPDGRALDPTADQFSNKRRTYPPVYLGKPTRIHKNATMFNPSPPDDVSQGRG